MSAFSRRWRASWPSTGSCPRSLILPRQQPAAEQALGTESVVPVEVTKVLAQRKKDFG